jgi:hypothetical protein
LGRWKKIGYSTLMMLGVITIIEALSFALLSVTERACMTYADVWVRQQQATADDSDLTAALTNQPTTAGNKKPQYVIHPYLGFVLDSKFHRDSRLERGGRQDLDFGFPQPEPGLFHPASCHVIAITGGSVAFNFAISGATYLREELIRGLQCHPERIKIVNLALPGYKQPQQLMTLSYFLALGAHFDVVVNIDGFNEVVLPQTDNVPKGVFPVFPRAWYFKIKEHDSSRRATVGELAFLREERARFAAAAASSPWRYSMTAALIWTRRDRLYARQIGERLQELGKQADNRRESYAVTGPPRRWANPDELYPKLVKVWRRSSEQMHHLATACGITYLHFLQPNQYVPGSKPIGPQEMRVALDSDNRCRPHVLAGYPLLIEEGQQLASTGVSFYDLTRLFAEVEDPIYVDTCCHYNESGQRLLAAAVAEAILDELRLR